MSERYTMDLDCDNLGEHDLQTEIGIEDENDNFNHEDKFVQRETYITGIYMNHTSKSLKHDECLGVTQPDFRTSDSNDDNEEVFDQPNDLDIITTEQDKSIKIKPHKEQKVRFL